MKRFPLALAAVTVALSVTTTTASAARSYSNCAALNKDYPHGVGKPGARDSTSGRAVTNFTRSSKLYNANRSRDRDGDGIACEKK
ncbi:MAG: excalibur calcium-binding domain-containing protein [Propionibacteriales bacterium]|nr:excalibur calcium-binding domain-containing protein [Propionibacteriales bacterium]